MKCTPLMMEFGNKTVAYAGIDTKMNDTRILGLMKLCKELKTCLKSTCYYPESTLKDVRVACDGIGLKNTYFMQCLTKIKTEKPDFTKYPCMLQSAVAGPDAMFTTKKWCTKTMFKEVCGDKSLNNFDRNCRVMVKLFGVVGASSDDDDE